MFGQKAAGQAQHIRIVFNQQDPFVLAAELVRGEPGGASRGLGFRKQGRQVDLEGAALARGAGHIDPAIMGLNDAVGDR